MIKEYRIAECEFCHQTRYIAAKGWCRTCYSRWQKTGQVEKKGRKRSTCKIDGCEEIVISHGFCSKHWSRVKKTGDPYTVRRPPGSEKNPDGDGVTKGKHPLYYSWSYAKLNGGVVDRWQKFWNFVADVGDRPTPTSRLCSIDGNAIGPTNFEWREPLPARGDAAAYARKHRKENPDYWRNIDLKKSYGITLERYNEMLKAQNGVCAICGKVNDIFDKRTGKVRGLSVDHCHTKGHVRKLLCQYCNQGLGNFKDDPALLRAAADYLDRNAAYKYFRKVDIDYVMREHKP